MGDYELVVFDLDDTILNDNHELDKRTVDTIKKLKKMGKKVTIATGRMYISALPFIKKLEIDLPVISYNGAYVCNPNDGQIIFHKTIPEKIALEIIKEVEKTDMQINLYREDDLYIKERNKGVEIYEEIAGVRGIPIGELSSNFHDSPTKMLIVERDREKKEYYLNYFKKNYRDKLEITESKEIFIEFMARGVSKGRALKELADQLGISKKEVVAFGDGFNDLEMIEWAGLGIAMENAPDDLKKRADKIAPDHNQQGVVQVLEDIFTI